MVLRQRAHARIGVRAAGKTKPTSNKEEEALQKKTSTRSTKLMN
jgi:hypothetical protein